MGRVLGGKTSDFWLAFILLPPSNKVSIRKPLGGGQGAGDEGGGHSRTGAQLQLDP